MHISLIKVKNFRAIEDAELKLDPNQKQDLTLIVGKNNSGKTSFIMIFDKFFKKENSFNFHDFSTKIRNKIYQVISKSIDDVVIGLTIEVSYSEEDNLEYLSEFITNLNNTNNTVKLYFECSVDEELLRNNLNNVDEEHRGRFIEKNLGTYLRRNLYIYEDESELKNKEKLIRKDVSEINKLINYQVIHAKRNLASSESSDKISLPLSKLSTEYFNKENIFSEKDFKEINNAILKMDEDLNNLYDNHFQGFFKNIREFLGDSSLKVLSNLESRQIMSNSSKVVQMDDNKNFLPESLNGLGNLNILYLLLQIDLKKNIFIQENKNINLFFIEEPEAHTHPQMQYIFSKKFKKMVQDIPSLQTLITTHSSHIVSQCDFKDIRYFQNSNGCIKIKNFYNDLEIMYSNNPEFFKFLKQYITLYAAELFFAEKVIFIEGISEKILLPYFIKLFDESKTETDYTPISSQNITYIEAGANAKVFQHLLNFFEIKSLIITDIDTTENLGGSACKVSDGKAISNETIKHYLEFYNIGFKDGAKHKEEKERKILEWLKKVINSEIEVSSPFIKLSYQTLENNYHARSFEDAFFSINYENIYKNKNKINGLRNISEMQENYTDFYDITNRVIESKSDFAASILYHALISNEGSEENKIIWNTPKYIREALEWISQ